MKKILLLDDNPDLLPLLFDQFMARNDIFEPYFTDKGSEALAMFFHAIAIASPFDALILDCSLPNFDGPHIVKHVRMAETIDSVARTSIAFYTGYDSEINQTDFVKKLGINAYFTKPQDTLDLPEKVAKWLGA